MNDFPLRQLSGSRHCKGGTLIAALVFVAISLLIVSAASQLMISTLGTVAAASRRESALGLAEVAAQSALERLNASPHSADGAPLWGVGEGGRRAEVVRDGALVASAGLVPTSGYNWRPTEAGTIRAEVTSPAVSRRIEVGFRPVSMLEDLALFSLDTLNINASATQVIGNVGTNRAFSGRSSGVTGTILFCGSTPSLAGSNVLHETDARRWPTAESLLLLYRDTTITQLATQNDNASISMFNPNNQAYLLNQAVAAGFTTLTRDLTTQVIRNMNVTTDGHRADSPGGTRYCSDSEGLYGRRVLILNPGDYYFTDIDLSGNQVGLLVNNAKGPVNIFIHSATGGNDSLRAYCHILSDDPRAFRIFYLKPGNFSIEGNSILRCLIYAVSESGSASVDFFGTSKLIGTIVAPSIRLTGSVTIEQPSNQSNTFGDPIWKYELTPTWRETSASGGSTYLDGGQH